MPGRLNVLWLLCLLGACAVGPDYRRPELAVPAAYRFAAAAAENGPAASPWWTQFADPVLDALVRAALAGNADLRMATARLEEYRAIHVATGGPLYPQVSLPATLTRSRQGESPVQTLYQAGLALSWELDFWGRIRRQSEAARADYLGQAAARQAVALSLVGALATSYVQLRELDARLDIARRTQADRQEELRLAGARFANGQISEMEVKQAAAENESTLFNVQVLEQMLARKEHEISLLLGRDPGPVPRGRSIHELQRPAVPAGLPSDLLGRRPDILLAEQSLVAANARVGAAKASLFPTISLTGAYGSASPELSDLFTGPARTWNFVPGVSLPIFSGGSLLARLGASEAQREQALAAYDKAIRAAFRETEDALVGVAKTGEQQATQARLLAEVARYARLARLRYEAGITSSLEVLDSQRNLFNAEQGHVQAQSAALVAAIDLYKALGGDWSALPATAEEAALRHEPGSMETENGN
ncbi:MAG: efflux transporter outer membrane subunit [Rhodocyclaceae bacterium]|nr:efflux transporter outer membrane subunit [Rhodocyclaceae bacterium]